MRPETKHSIVLIAGTGTTAVLSMVYSVYAGNALGPAKYADFTTAVSLVMMCQIALGPINGTVTRFTAKYAASGEYGKVIVLSREIAKRVALYGLIGGAIALLFLRPVANVLQFASIWPLAMAYIVTYLILLLSVPRGVLRGVQNFRQYNINIVLESAIRLTVGVLFLKASCTVVSGLSAYFAALVAILLVSLFQLRSVWAGHQPEQVDGSAIRRFTVPMLILTMTSAGYQNIDMLFVKHAFAETEAGVYSAAFTLSRAISVLVTPFITILLPLITTLHEQKREITTTIARICGYFVLMSAVPMIVFMFWPDIVLRLYRTEFADAAALLLPLTGARLLAFLCYLLCLACASVNSFRFLCVYLPGVVLQGTALFLWGESLTAVTTVMLVTQAISLGAMVGMLVHQMYRRTKQPGFEQPVSRDE